MKVLSILLFCWTLRGQSPFEFLNHGEPLLDAHNCYPYEGQWLDRIDRALRTGIPVGIEQDLAWSIDANGNGHVVVSHTSKTTGSEPTLKDHFFERVRPIVEQALRENDKSKWPLIILHFDVKDNRPELHRAVWDLLGEYTNWITTAEKRLDLSVLAPLDPKPLLVLTEDNDAQEQVFFKEVPVGARLRLFGSAHTGKLPGSTTREKTHAAATLSPEVLLAEPPTNYRRWWNNSWWEVEEGGQREAGEWTHADDERLRALVNRAHQLGFWIRFYTLDGFNAADNRGWEEGYSFGSHEAVLIRWRAALAAGVDLIATDQYESLAALVYGTH
ncbi:MAG: hypothetical protein ABI833_04765 [Acidobacteriota bacterium]